MNPAQLVDHFDRISEAPDAVPRLRRFILDLAVRGILVEQNRGDEPAFELLKRIQTERERLVKTGEIRRGKPFPPLSPDERPFREPAGWEWVRVRQVTSDRGQTIPEKDFTYIDVTAINKEVGCVANARVLAPTDAPSRARKLVRKGDVLYSCVRPYLMNIAVIESDIVPSPIASTAFAVLNGFGLILPRYLWVAFRSPLMVECVETKMRGQAYTAINDSDFAMLPLPLPPLAEQHRIVTIVNELMSLCDRLEEAQAERERRRGRLTAASLHRLNQPADEGDGAGFREHARFHISHLSRFTTMPDQVPALRQAILNLAIRGKLVPGEPNDLLIPALRRADKSSSFDVRVFSEALASLTVPPHWSVEPLASVAAVIVDCPHSTPKWTETGRICVRTNQFRPGFLDLSDVRFVSEETYSERIERLRPLENDILYSREGGILGVACRVPPNIQLCLGQRMMLIRAGATTDSAFLEMVLNSPLIGEIARGNTTGAAAPRVNVSTVRAYPIPLPPLAEQRRILAKVEELMTLCDSLESQLASARAVSQRLLQAVLHEAFASAA